jgi:hypothetical protein
MDTTSKNVSTPSDCVASMSSDWPMLRALMGGTRAMRAAGKTYLPPFPQEEDKAYQARLGSAVLHPVYSRTCKVMAAKPFSEPVGMTGFSAQTLDWLRDCDRAGSNWQAFAMQTALNAIAYGIECVQVEFAGDGAARTKAEEQRAGARPYLVRWPAGTVLGWKTDPATGSLSQIRLLETIPADDGQFHERVIEQVRVLKPGLWTIYRKNEAGEWILHDSGDTSLDVIPVVFVYGQREALGVGCPLMLDLAYQNVEHWQTRSDQQTILHVARVPILFAKGFANGDNIVIGASQATQASSEGADLRYVEHTGAAIAAGKADIDDLEERMRKTGAEVLTIPIAQKTATQAGIEADASKSLMQAFAENLEDSLCEIMALWCRWTGEPPGTVEIKKRFTEPVEPGQQQQATNPAA